MDAKTKKNQNWELKENTFSASDNEQLFYRVWQPARKSKKVILMLHRGHEHSGRLVNIVNDLAMNDHWVFAWDQRGHGKSSGERGYASNYNVLIDDLNTFVKHIEDEYSLKTQDIVVIANSIGAVLATTWVHDYAPDIKAFVLVAPAFSVKLYIPLAIPSLRLLNRFKKPAYVKSYVKAKMLTHDAEEVIAYENDELISPKIAVNILLGLHDAGKRIVKNAGAITVPTLIFSADKDWVVRRAPQLLFYERISTTQKAFHVLENFYHGVLYEKGHERVISTTRDFIKDIEKQTTAQIKSRKPNYLKADQQGYSHYQYQKLLATPNIFMQLNWWLQKKTIELSGKLANGVKIGLESGFDSGLALDYVYENKAQGKTWLGRVIDRQYLNAIGWRGIRQRRIDMQTALNFGINQTLEKHKSVKIYDIAAGGGRYLLDCVAQHAQKDKISLVLHDLVEANLQKAQQTASEFDINNIITQQQNLIESIDADLSESCDLAICSGIFELLSDNSIVMAGLKKLADSLKSGAYLIYTSQTWHPQVEMIAHCLPNHFQEAWRMRLRTQAEMDALVAEAGLEKIKTYIGLEGIFNVSIACKAAHKSAGKKDIVNG